jgi:serine/threonine-protein kinase
VTSIPASAPTPPAPVAAPEAPAPELRVAESPRPVKPARPKAAPRKAVDAPRLAPGRLSIDATPWATIYVDGARLGVTPLVGVAVPAGNHAIKAVTEDGRSQVVRVDVQPDGDVRRKLRW